MKIDKNAHHVDRRQFLKSLPQFLVNEVLSNSKQNNHKQKAEQVAFIKVDQCHAWMGMSCQQCYLACPMREEAIKIEDQKPTIVESVCNGCDMCNVACQTVNHPSAISMVARSIKSE